MNVNDMFYDAFYILNLKLLIRRMPLYISKMLSSQNIMNVHFPPVTDEHIRIIKNYLLMLIIIIGSTFSPNDALCWQDSKNQYFVNTIYLVGNKVTKDNIILRELSFYKGSYITKKNIDDFLNLENYKVFNTNLFIASKITYKLINNIDIDIYVTVSEKWYIWPIPLFELTDDFNTWWNNRNKDLSRVQYGVNFKRRNFRGRNELLKIKLQFGFTNKIQLQYSIPFISNKQKIGLNFQLFYAKNKTSDYINDANKPLTISSETELKSRIYTSVSVSKRIRYYATNLLELKYSNSSIADTIMCLNPLFFGEGNTSLKYFGLIYTYKRDFVDKVFYPLKGSSFKFIFDKKGLGIYNEINNFDISTTYSKYIKVKNKLFYALNALAIISFPKNQNYFTQKGIGSERILRGYDLYTIPGTKTALIKNTFKWKIFEKQCQTKPIMKTKQFSTIPIEIFLKGIMDYGRVSNTLVTSENERLTNQHLWGAGLGLDFVTFYNTAFRLNYTYNKDGEKNFSVYFKADI